VTWVHGNELLGSCLAISVNDLETLFFEFESLGDGKTAVAVGGCN
jgi:hypothetical protein